MGARDIISRALQEGRTKLLEDEALELIRLYGGDVAPFGVAKGPEDAAKVAKDVGFPVVVKVISPDISHKSDVGGVVLNLRSEEDVRKAVEGMLRNVPQRAKGARIVGVLVQKMAKPGLEVIVGSMRDPVFGPVLMFGLGGIFVEVLRDVSFRVAPVTMEDAIEMLGEIKSSKILDGYRGMPAIDKRAIAKIIVALSKLMEENDEIASVDLNPIEAYPDGAVVVDARVILSDRGA
ncbi:MAG: acetate--CoA ligase family protein [Desulfurococcaceae archaeon]